MGCGVLGRARTPNLRGILGHRLKSKPAIRLTFNNIIMAWQLQIIVAVIRGRRQCHAHARRPSQHRWFASKFVVVTSARVWTVRYGRDASDDL
jgi:hypothetical protein